MEQLERANFEAPVCSDEDTYSGSSWSRFRDLPDGEYFTINEDIVLRPGMVVVPNLQLLEQVLDMQSVFTGEAHTPSSIATILRHESDHAEAGKQLGSESSYFGIQLKRIKSVYYDDEYRTAYQSAFCLNLNFNTTKLGHAIVMAAPEEFRPLKGDIDFIRDLGYKSVQDVAHKAAALGSQHSITYPVPKSLS